MSGLTGYFEIVNSNILVPYSSASNYDMVIRTEGMNQRMFFGNSNGAILPAMVITSNMVGVGKSNPTNTLDINGNIFCNSNITVNSSNPNIIFKAMDNFNTDAGNLYWQNSGGNYVIRVGRRYNPDNTAYPRFIISTGNVVTATSLVDTVTITADSNFVGIGKSNPSYPLDVVGNVSLGSSSNASIGNICAGNLGMYRNKIMNGDMRIAQRGTSSNLASGGFTYLLDRWGVNSAGTNPGYTVSQSALSSTDAPYALGFKYSLKIQMSGATPSLAYMLAGHGIEGLNMIDLNWGTSSGSPVVISFWFKSTNTGTGNVTIRKSPNNTDAYVATFTINSANTWQYVVLNIPAPPATGLWPSDASGSINIYIGAYHSSKNITPNSWQVPSAFTYSSTTVSSIYDTANAVVEFTGVQFEKGTMATPFEFRPIGTELQLCQRYYQRLTTSSTYPTTTGTANVQWIKLGLGIGINSTSVQINSVNGLRTTMRVQPTYSGSGTAELYNFTDASQDVNLASGVTLSTTESTTDTVCLNVAGTGITAGRTYIFQTKTIPAFMAFSADI